MSYLKILDIRKDKLDLWFNEYVKLDFCAHYPYYPDDEYKNYGYKDFISFKCLNTTERMVVDFIDNNANISQRKYQPSLKEFITNFKEGLRIIYNYDIQDIKVGVSNIIEIINGTTYHYSLKDKKNYRRSQEDIEKQNFCRGLVDKNIKYEKKDELPEISNLILIIGELVTLINNISYGTKIKFKTKSCDNPWCIENRSRDLEKTITKILYDISVYSAHTISEISQLMIDNNLNQIIEKMELSKLDIIENYIRDKLKFIDENYDKSFWKKAYKIKRETEKKKLKEYYS